MLPFRVFAATQLRFAFSPSHLRVLGDLCVQNPPSVDPHFHTSRRTSVKLSQKNPLKSVPYILFQVPYPLSPLFATLTKTTGAWPNSSHSGTLPQTSASVAATVMTLFARSFRSLHQERLTTPL